MYGDYSIRMSLATNGFIVTYSDPSIIEKNREEDSRYQDPDVSVVYKSAEEMAAGVATLVPMLAQAMEKDTDYDSAISDAIASEESSE